MSKFRILYRNLRKNILIVSNELNKIKDFKQIFSQQRETYLKSMILNIMTYFSYKCKQYVLLKNFYNMYLQSFIRKQKLNRNIEECWDFFSNPKNLSLITPPEMNFVILTELPKEVYPGLIIQYKVSPLLSIPMNWVTEITQVNKPIFFIDEQRFGPYKFWHHQHIFKEIDDGVEMTDIVHYRIPFGYIGKFIGNRIVKKQLNKIFDFRAQKILDIFK